jgi:penicillin-binding protein 1C
VQVKTAEFPPLAKFAARFGIVKWKADPTLPVILRNLEPERHDWFLHGTEPHQPAARLAEGLPQIRMPVPGEVIALDPDIPATSQRMVFAGESVSGEQRWWLDGQDLGPVKGPLLWEPVPGQHTLSLLDRERRALDTVRFEVRPMLTTGDSPPSRKW